MPIGKSSTQYQYYLGGNTSVKRILTGDTSGELFDLEALAHLCEEHQRWTFFISSVPLNMPGGVSSPPNVMAIF